MLKTLFIILCEMNNSKSNQIKFSILLPNKNLLNMKYEKNTNS